MFKIVDGHIFMGETPIFGHGCNTLTEKQDYCDAMNQEVGCDPAFEAMMVASDAKLAALPAESKKQILDLLGDDWRHY